MAGVIRRLFAAAERHEGQHASGLGSFRSTNLIEDEIAGITRVKFGEICIEIELVGRGIKLLLIEEEFLLRITPREIPHHNILLVFAARLAACNAVTEALQKR